jgi:hypothetical protein
MLNYSILTADTNQAKSLSIVNNKLVKSSLANPTRGYFTAHTCNTLHEFADHINKLTVKQSLIIGSVVRPDKTVLAVGEKIALTTKAKPRDNAVSRSLDYLKNLNHAGFMLFDIDSRPESFADLQLFIPELQSVGAVVKPSSSSLIFDKNGSEIVGDKGRHIFVPVLDMSDIERASKAIWGRQWLNGHGHYLISNGIHPMLLERGIYDQTVLGHSERLAFEAKPLLNDGLTQKYNHCVVIDGGFLDTRLIVDLTHEELEQVEQLKHAAKKLVRPEYDAVIVKKKAEYIASGKTESDWNGLKNHILPYDFEVTTTKGVFKVEDLNQSHDGVTLRDPFEPDYDGGSLTKAKFFWNDGKPKIYSQAHGGINYKIAKNEPAQQPSGELEFFDNTAWNWWLELCAHVERFNKSHAQVALGGKHKILRIVPASHSPNGRETLEFFSQKELVLLYQNDKIKTGEKKTRNGVEDVYKDKITAWATHKDCQTFKGGVIFKPYPPGKEPATNGHYFNTWRGYSVEPKENNELLTTIKFHINEVVSNGDTAVSEYIYNWIAYTFQNPDKPAGAAIVLRGGKGAGKGTIGHFLAKIWGTHAMHMSNSKHLTGNFNAHLADVCFLFADEAFYSGDKHGESTLKALITEPVMTIERKGIDTVQQPNYLKVFMATNSDFAVPATRDERRYLVTDVADSYTGDRDYFINLHSDVINPDVQAAFLFEMLNRDVTRFHTGQIPETQGLRDQRSHSLCTIGKWLLDCLEQECFYHRSSREVIQTLWDGQNIPARDLWQSYILWCDEQKISEYKRVTQTALGLHLSKVGFLKKRASAGITWIMMTHEEARQLFITEHKI